MRQQLSQEELNILHGELKLNEVLSQGVATEFCKTLLQILENTIKMCEQEWVGKGMNLVDDNELIKYRSAIRSKVQTLKALQNKILSSGEEAKRLQMELNS